MGAWSRRYFRLKAPLGITFFVVAITAGYLGYLYYRGGVENYRPPAAMDDSVKTEVLRNLTALSQAIEAYHAKNLEYPERLEQLQPEFIDKVPPQPGIGKAFTYESDGRNRYRVGISDPTYYGFQEFFAENGKIVQN